VKVTPALWVLLHQEPRRPPSRRIWRIRGSRDDVNAASTHVFLAERLGPSALGEGHLHRRPALRRELKPSVSRRRSSASWAIPSPRVVLSTLDEEIMSREWGFWLSAKVLADGEGPVSGSDWSADLQRGMGTGLVRREVGASLGS
jgi:hypothetical protein